MYALPWLLLIVFLVVWASISDAGGNFFEAMAITVITAFAVGVFALVVWSIWVLTGHGLGWTVLISLLVGCGLLAWLKGDLP